MTFTVSAVVLLGLATFFLLKSKTISAGSALAVFLFGFFTAGTGAYEPIHTLSASVADFLANLRP